MKITRKEWKAYTDRLAKLNNTTSELVVGYIEEHGIEDASALIDYSYKVAKKYANASAALNALMYDTIAEMEAIVLPAAELAALPTYGDVAKAVYGTLKTSVNGHEIAGAVSRLVKLTGEDTMLKNAKRDHAEAAWIPEGGETCAFCLALASRGWESVSRAGYDGHAEHIHSNCQCSYMVRHSEDFGVRGYDPDEYKKMYYDADPGGSSKDKINAMRRQAYAENKDAINEQKRMAYRARVLAEEDADEIKVN